MVVIRIVICIHKLSYPIRLQTQTFKNDKEQYKYSAVLVYSTEYSTVLVST